MPREEEKIIIEEITALRREVIEFKTMYKELQESYDELHAKVAYMEELLNEIKLDWL